MLGMRERVLATMLGELRSVRVVPCVKGRFYDAMADKLRQLAGVNSNEVRPFDLEATCSAIAEYSPRIGMMWREGYAGEARGLT